MARDGAFTSRRGTGLRPPKGCGRSGRKARYGPQAGEGVLTTRAVPIFMAARNLALSIFKAMRDSSSPGAPRNDRPDRFFRSL